MCALAVMAHVGGTPCFRSDDFFPMDFDLDEEFSDTQYISVPVNNFPINLHVGANRSR